MIADLSSLPVSNTVSAVVAALGGTVLGLRVAAPAVRDVIREIRRPDNADYQDYLQVRDLLRRVNSSIYGTPAYEALSQSLREDLEAEFKK